MGRPFQDEVMQLPQSIEWALNLDISDFKRCIKAANDQELIVVGSGGSSTAAVFLANMHLRQSGRIAKSMTPLEYVRTAQFLKSSFNILLSAEGRNKDILAAAKAISLYSSSGIALTLTNSNPLIDISRKNGSPTMFAFGMPWIKDGYLATNSLIAMMILIARAYSDDEDQLKKNIRGFNLDWLLKRRMTYSTSTVWENLIPFQPIIVLYGENGQAAAIDIESKLAEASIAFCQAVDYRQFAHGRHLQLASNNAPPLVLALISSADEALALKTLDLLPKSVKVHTIRLPADPVIGEIVGVIDSIILTECIAQRTHVDPGRPNVPEFGRQIHALDFTELIETNNIKKVPSIFLRKLPWVKRRVDIPFHYIQSSYAFLNRLKTAKFKALVCDFDGTYCDTNHRFEGMDPCLIPEIERLLSTGVLVGFATGRGDSLQNNLRKKIAPKFWPSIFIGYYSGSNIHTLDHNFVPPEPDVRFNELRAWLYEIGLVTNEKALRSNAGQLGLTCESISYRTNALSAIRHWLKSKELHGWRAYTSGHSIDVITEYASKTNVVDHISKILNCSSDQEILRIGDSGQFDGNDFELLSSGLGLSVASVSSLPESGWNFLPDEKSNSVGTLHYLCALDAIDGKAKFQESFFRQFESEFINL